MGSGAVTPDVRVDIMAHLFGFVAGLFIGAGYGALVKKSQKICFNGRVAGVLHSLLGLVG
ncbi:MAG: hypothetical protein R2860_13905 [Desulfobacterales bacterium]